MATYTDRDMLKAVIQERKMAKSAAGGGAQDRKENFPQWRPSYNQQQYQPAAATTPGMTPNTMSTEELYNAIVAQQQSGLTGYDPSARVQLEYGINQLPSLEQFEVMTDPSKRLEYEYLEEPTPTLQQQEHWQAITDYYKTINTEAAKLGLTPSDYEQMMRDYQGMGNLKYGAPPAAYKQLEYGVQPQQSYAVGTTAEAVELQYPQSISPEDYYTSMLALQNFKGWAPDKYSPISPANIAAEYGKSFQVTAVPNPDDPLNMTAQAELAARRAALQVAYDYLRNLPLNQGKPASEWVWASVNDPQLRNLMQVMPDLMNYQVDAETKLAWTQASYPLTELGNQPVLPYGQVYQPGGLLFPSRVVEIPGVYKALYNFTNSPWAMGALNATPFAILSGLTHAVPTLIGGAFAGEFMGQLSQIGDKNGVAYQYIADRLSKPVADIFSAMAHFYVTGNILPSVWMEQAVGVSGMNLNYLTRALPELVGALKSYIEGDTAEHKRHLDNYVQIGNEFWAPGLQPGKNTFQEIATESYKRYWQAGLFTYESTAPELPIALNIPIGIANSMTWLTGESKVPYVKRGYILPYGAAEPEKIVIPGVDPNVPYQSELALTYLANKYAFGATSLEQQTIEAQELFGVGGNITDFVYSTILDPLWLAPAMQRFALGKMIGSWTNNARLIEATNLAGQYGGGAVTALRLYANTTIPYSALDGGKLTKMQLWLSPLAETADGYDLKFNKFSNRFTGFAFQLLESPIDPINWITSMRQLSPNSKAHLYSQMSYEYFGMLMNNVRSDIHTDVYKAMIDAARQISTGADPSSIVRLGALLDSPALAVVRQGSVDAYAAIKKWYDGWSKGQINIDQLTKLSGELKISGIELVSRWNSYEGSSKQKYSRLAKVFNLEPTGFTESAVTRMFDWVNKNPWTPEGFQSEITNIFLDRQADFAIQHYGVGKDFKAVRGFMNYVGGLKALQSALLLNLSWNYARRNILNNTVTAPIYGVFSIALKSVRNNFWNDFGFLPYGASTLPQELWGGGFGESGKQAVSIVSRAIREAEKEGMKGAVSQYFKDGASWVAQKANIFGHVSSFGEIKAREEANYIGTKKAWSYTYRPEIPQDVMNILRSVRAGLPDDMLNRLIGAGARVDEVAAVLRGEATPLRWETGVTPAAKAMGMDPAHFMETVRFFGMDEYLRSQLDLVQQGKRNIDMVGRDLFRKMEDGLRSMSENELLAIATSAEALSSNEGMVSAHNLMVDLEILRNETMQYAQNEWDTAAKTDNDAAYGEAEVAVKKLWDNFYKRRDATITGVLKSWGFTDGSVDPILSKNAVELAGIYMDYMHSFDRFFAERSRMWNEARALPSKQRAAAFGETKRVLFDMYPQFAGDEVRNIQRVADQFDKMFVEQFQGIDPTPLRDYFRQLIANARQRHDAVLDMRRFELGDVNKSSYKNPDVYKLIYGQQPANSETLWPRFWTEIYNPIVLDGMQKINKAQGDMNVAIETRQPAPPEVEPVAPIVDERAGIIGEARDNILKLVPGADELVDNLINTMFNEPPARMVGTQDIDDILAAYPEFFDPAIRAEVASQFYDVLYADKLIAQAKLRTIGAAEQTIADFGGAKSEAVAEAPRSFKGEIVQGIIRAGIADNAKEAVAILKVLRLPDDTPLSEVVRIAQEYRVQKDRLIAEGAKDGPKATKDAATLARLELKRDPLVTGPMLGGKMADNGLVAMQNTDINEEPYRKVIKPVMQQLFKELKAIKEMPFGGELRNLTPDQQAVYAKWVQKFQQDYSQSKLLAMRAGVTQADMALLNYNMRSNFNSTIAIGFPFIFWTMRSANNWAWTMLERPALMATYIRLLKLMASHSEEESQFPTRHKGKIRIPSRFLPPWAGDAIYYDPMSDLIPFNQFVRPFERTASLTSRLTDDALNSLKSDFRNGIITGKQFMDAVGTDGRGVPGNALFDAAKQQAQSENDGTWEDFMQLFSSPNLFFSMFYNMYQNKKNGTSEPLLNQLPVSKTWQGMWGMFGQEPPELKTWLGQQLFGVSEFGEWGVYYVKRAVANIAAQDPSRTQEALIALVEQSGDIWKEAEQQVRFEQGMQAGLAPFYAANNIGKTGFKGLAGALLLGLFPGGLVPEGELKQRYLSKEYDSAWQAYNSGTDPGALDKFFDAYPEYDVRRLMFEEDPEKLFNRFLGMQMLDTYWDDNVTDLQRRAMREQMGEEWYTTVINSGTRNPVENNPEKMAAWASAMGRYVPTPPTGAYKYETQKLNLPSAEMSQVYDQMMQERLSIAPDYYALNDLWHSLPIMGREQMLQSFPQFEQAMSARRAAIEKYVIAEIPNFTELQNDYYAIGSGILESLAEDGKQLSQAWKLLGNLRTQMLDPLGDWKALQDAYFAAGPKGSAERKAFLVANQILKQIWDTQDEMDKIIDTAYPSYRYLNELYYRMGGDARKKFLKDNPNLKVGWDILAEHKDEWLSIDPDYEKHNDEYWDMPPSPRSLMLTAYPELERAWGIEDVYIQQNPGLNEWINQEQQQEQYKATQDVIESIPPLAYPSVLKYFALDEPLSQGAREALEWEWEKRGKPFGDFYEWLESMRYYFQ